MAFFQTYPYGQAPWFYSICLTERCHQSGSFTDSHCHLRQVICLLNISDFSLTKNEDNCLSLLQGCGTMVKYVGHKAVIEAPDTLDRDTLEKNNLIRSQKQILKHSLL